MNLHQTERLTIAAACLNPPIIERLTLTPADFDEPLHATLWANLTADYERTTNIDPIGIYRGIHDHQIPDAQHIIIGLRDSAPVAQVAIEYATAILEASDRRRIKTALLAAAQEADRDDLTASAILEQVSERLSAVESRDQDVELTTLEDFVAIPTTTQSWVIPGLLTEGDRVIITGWEGLGKTMLLRQIGEAVAMGAHPFTFENIPPQRVLYLDFENPERVMVQKFGAIHSQLQDWGFRADGRMAIHRRPQGIDLHQPRDRAWLRRIVRKARPDLLICGPVYKMYMPSKGGGEVDARVVTDAIDQVRAEFGCAVALEQHSPMAQNGERAIRPYGSVQWQRWPEFGYGLTVMDGYEISDRIVNFVPWRGARDERDWPEALRRGDGDMPWQPIENQYRARETEDPAEKWRKGRAA